MVSTEAANIVPCKLEDLLSVNGRLSTRFDSVASAIQESNYSTIDLLTTALAVQNTNYTGKTAKGRAQHNRTQRDALKGIYSSLDKPVARQLEQMVRLRNSNVCSSQVKNYSLAAKSVLYRNIASDLGEEVDTDLLNAARKLTSTGYAWEKKAELVIESLQEIRDKYGTLEFEEGSLNADIVSEMQSYVHNNKILNKDKRNLQLRLDTVFAEPVLKIERVPTPAHSPILPIDKSDSEVEAEFFAAGNNGDYSGEDYVETVPESPFGGSYERTVSGVGKAMVAVAAVGLFALVNHAGPELKDAVDNGMLGVGNQTVFSDRFPDKETAVETTKKEEPESEKEFSKLIITSLEEGDYIFTALSQSEEVPIDVMVSSEMGIGIQNPVAVLGPNYDYFADNISDFMFVSNVDNLHVSSPFGAVRKVAANEGEEIFDAEGGPLTRIHLGTDFPLPIGTPLRSPIYPLSVEDNFLACRFSGPVTGKYLVITGEDEAGNLHEERMLHLDSFGSMFYSDGKESRCIPLTVADKDKVIANSGDTGRSTGPHLHHESKINGIMQDPEEKIYDPLRVDPAKSEERIYDPSLRLVLDLPAHEIETLKERFPNSLDGYSDASL